MTSEQEPPEVLSLAGVDVFLSGRKILDQVNFTVRAGEFTGLIGSNGAGKTTIFRVVLGLVSPSAGSIEICGKPRSRRSQLIGYVPQKIALDPDMPLRARDFVGLGLDGHCYGIPLPSKKRKALVEEMLVSVGAERLADSRVGNLSGGEQQRVMIAHALISKPKLILLDEPLANLDISSEADVVALVSKVARNNDIAILLSAHDMNPLLPVMDRIVYLAGGRAASGTTEEVVQPEILSRLYGHHVDVIHLHSRILVVATPDAPAGLRHSDADVGFRPALHRDS